MTESDEKFPIYCMLIDNLNKSNKFLFNLTSNHPLAEKTLNVL